MCKTNCIKYIFQQQQLANIHSAFIYIVLQPSGNNLAVGSSYIHIQIFAQQLRKMYLHMFVADCL